MQSIRVNTLKITKSELKEMLEKNYEVQEVPWYDAALLVNTELKTHNALRITQTSEYSKGFFYLQSLASMLPVIALDPKPGEHVLDLAAAPGSKTTQIAMHINNEGMLVANDSSYLRLKPLKYNLRRLGITCCKITNYDGRRFPSRLRFHRILLDAPCSGLGSKHTHSNYSPNRLKQMAKLQRELLIHAFDLLLPNGRLIYSTCTTRNEENEDVIQHLLNKRSEAKLKKPILPAMSDGVWDMGSVSSVSRNALCVRDAIRKTENAERNTQSSSSEGASSQLIAIHIGARVKLDEFFFVAQVEKFQE